MLRSTIQARIEYTDEDLLQGIGRYMKRLKNNGFYGILEIQFQDGQVVLIRKQESFKPSSFLVVE